MTTVKAISKAAFDAVAAKITDVVYAATMEHDVQGVYNTTTGSYALTTTTLTGGRAVFETSTAISDVFPAYTVGPSDLLIALEGFTTVPKVGWRVVANGTRTIKAVGDIAGAGNFFRVVAA